MTYCSELDYKTRCTVSDSKLKLTADRLLAWVFVRGKVLATLAREVML